MVLDRLKSIFGGEGEGEEVEEEREGEREELSLEEVRKRIAGRKSHPLQEVEKDYHPLSLVGFLIREVLEKYYALDFL